MSTKTNRYRQRRYCIALGAAVCVVLRTKSSYTLQDVPHRLRTIIYCNLGGFLLSDWEMYIDYWGEKRYFCLTGERGCKIPHRNIMSQIFKMRQ